MITDDSSWESTGDAMRDAYMIYCVNHLGQEVKAAANSWYYDSPLALCWRTSWHASYKYYRVIEEDI